MFQTKLYRRNQKAEFVAGIMALSLKTNGVKITLRQKSAHCVSDLNLVHRSGCCFFDFGKDIRRQNVTSNNRQIRWRLRKWWFLNHIFDSINPILDLLDIQCAKS